MAQYQIIHLSEQANPDTEGRRCTLYRLSRQFVFDFLKGGRTYRVVENPMPDDAQVVGLAYDVLQDIYIALVESRAFPLTPPSQIFPYADDPVIHVQPDPPADRDTTGGD